MPAFIMFEFQKICRHLKLINSKNVYKKGILVYRTEASIIPIRYTQGICLNHHNNGITVRMAPNFVEIKSYRKINVDKPEKF